MGAVAPFTQDLIEGGDMAVIGERVSVFARADAASPVLATLGYVIVTRVFDAPGCDEAGSDWVCVASTEGPHGWIAIDDVREIIEEHVHFSKTPQGCRLVAFGATC